MSVRYTLRLVEHGAEVWKRWTADREEALRDLAATLVDLECPQRRAEFAMTNAATLEAALEPGEYRELHVLNDDLTVSLEFEVRQKGHSVSSE